MVELVLRGFVFSLYVDKVFIEYFASMDDAVGYASVVYKGAEFLVKPVAFFGVSG